MSKHAAQAETPRWETVYLVCKACGKRGSGPKDSKPKAIAAALRRREKGQRPRPRVVFSSCLGLCPKSATAVARVGAVGARIAAIRSPAQVDEAFPIVVARAAHDDRTRIT